MIAALLISAVACSRNADDPLETACFERDQSQQGMNRCAGEALQRAEKDMDAQWAKLLEDYRDDADATKLLVEWQRAWLGYRDAECEVAAMGSRGGSIWPMEVAMCAADMTRKRTRELAAMVESEAN